MLKIGFAKICFSTPAFSFSLQDIEACLGKKHHCPYSSRGDPPLFLGCSLRSWVKLSNLVEQDTRVENTDSTRFIACRPSATINFVMYNHTHRSFVPN